ncbi:hypothetical protein BHM03_00018414 [Ensete ventricosum]|nr:hypothetical protein BHM03_00018414 [Ensete ventricosum]
MADIDQCWSDVGSRPGSVVSCEGEVVATAEEDVARSDKEVQGGGDKRVDRSRGKEEGSDDIGVAKEGATKVTATTKDNVATKEEGRPATTSPHAGLATHGQAVAKAAYKGVAGCGQGQSAREADAARKGSSPQGRPAPLVWAAARRGDAYGQDRL